CALRPSPLFPYTTLFRSLVASAAIGTQGASAGSSNNIVLVPPAGLPESARKAGEAMFLHEAHDGRTDLYIESFAEKHRLSTFSRSEEHTSELQSLAYLVC